MADNVTSSVGAVVVATEEGPQGEQHQRTVAEFMHGDVPRNVSTQTSLPIYSDQIVELLTSILLELRVSNYMAHQLGWPELEHVEDMRAQFSVLPVTL